MFSKHKPKLLFVFLLSLFEALCWDRLINSQSTAETVALYNRLGTTYGRYVLSGQTNFRYSDLVKKVGKNPVIQSFDMQNYSPHNPWFNWQPYDDGTVSSAIEWYKKTNQKGIVSFHWHWFSPSGGNLRTSTFYTNNTDFDIKKAITLGTTEYNETIRDIDAISIQLKKLQTEKIPIIWRPLHEAGGKWFWWGSKTNSETLKLYDILYDRIARYHGINNLIWEWSSPEKEWYPGNLKVDMIGYDSYPGSFNYNCRMDMYLKLKNIVGNTKMINLSENGPIPNWNSCFQEGATWGYFLSWSDLVFEQNSEEHLIEVYEKSYHVVKLEDYD